MATRRRAGVAEYTIDRELKMLKGVINKAVEHDWLVENPVKVWPKIKTEARKEFIPRERVEEIIATTDLSDEEIKDLGGRMLLSAEDIADLVSLAEDRLPQLAVPLALVGVTGIRRTELVTAKKSDLDMSKWTLTVSSDKGSRKKKQVRRTIEIHQSVVPMLKDHLKTLRKSDKLLFPVFARINGGNRDSDKDINARCDRAHRLLGRLVNDTRWMMLKGWHTLRHSAISIYLDQGYTFDQIAKWTGHVDPETQKLYTHWFDRQARERMDKVPFEFNHGRRNNKKAPTRKRQAGNLSRDKVEQLLLENRSLKAQLRAMHVGKVRIDSLRRRVRVLEKRLGTITPFG